MSDMDAAQTCATADLVPLGSTPTPARVATRAAGPGALGQARAPVTKRIGKVRDRRAPGVHRLIEADIPAVADLFQEVFLHQPTRAPSTLKDYLSDILVADPWAESSLASRVFVAEDGGVEGFVGALPTRMKLGEKPLRALVATSMMVRGPARRPFAGAQLLRSLLDGPQDLTFTDSASDLSLAMWQGAGARLLPGRSANWIRVLRPAKGAVSMLAKKIPLARRLRPLAGGADALLRAIRCTPFALPERKYRAVDASAAEFFDASAQLEGQFAVRPDWDCEAFDWRLGHACRHRTRGPLRCRMVLDRRDRLMGCYLYRVGPDSTAFIVHFITRPGETLPVLTTLLNDAVDDRLAAVWGRVTPDLLGPVLRLRSLVVRASHTLVHSRDPEVLAAARADDLFVGGLAGERWIRLVDDTFE